MKKIHQIFLYGHTFSFLFRITGPYGDGNGYSLQYSCLENPIDRGAWRATVHGVTESDMTKRLTHIGDQQGALQSLRQRPSPQGEGLFLASHLDSANGKSAVGSLLLLHPPSLPLYKSFLFCIFPSILFSSHIFNNLNVPIYTSIK